MIKYVVLGAQTQNNVINSCTKIVVSLRCCVLCMCVNRSFHARQISGFADGAKLIWKSLNLYGGGDRFPVQGHSCWSASLVRVKWPLLTCTDNVATESRTHPLYIYICIFRTAMRNINTQRSDVNEKPHHLLQLHVLLWPFVVEPQSSRSR